MKNFNFNETFPDLPEPNWQEITEEVERKSVESAADDIKEISPQQLADLLEAANHTITVNRAGMLINTFKHSTLGTVTTIQASGDSALLFRHL
ncbi:MAG: hypothetical protein PHY54_17680 [Methylococcales bacterium]|nr:hypothetical protein [Methylococcales bacterium]